MTEPRVIHKKTGNFLEDFRPGQIFRHKLGKTVTEGLFTAFTEFAMTTSPLAKNARYARAHGFAGLVVPPGLGMLIAFSQTVEDVSENARANLEYIDMRFGAPLYVGDTIEVTTKVLGIKTSASRPNLGVVHVQSTARKNVGEPGEAVALTWQRKVQVYKQDDAAKVNEGEIAPDAITCELWLPPHDPKRDYRALAHLSNADTYFEDFEPGTRIEHSRGRTMTSEHIHLTAILDNTSQVHCNQHMIDLNPEQYVGGQLIIFGGIPFVLCLGLSCPDIADNALGDLAYKTGKHTAPLFAGDTVFAATEILGKRDLTGRPDLGVLATRLFGYKPRAKQSSERVQIFELDREIVVKRRSHYA
ncbi:MAG: MaoC family dehydratase [Myxococcota bacterium]|jgi:2-methylfumaryl-CoA hydratase